MSASKLELFAEAYSNKLKFIERICVFKINHDSIQENNIELTISDLDPNIKRLILLSFFDAVEIRIGDLNGMLSTVIEIIDIST